MIPFELIEFNGIMSVAVDLDARAQSWVGLAAQRVEIDDISRSYA